MPLGKGNCVQSVRVQQKVYVGDTTPYAAHDDFTVMEYDTQWPCYTLAVNCTRVGQFRHSCDVGIAPPYLIAS